MKTRVMVSCCSHRPEYSSILSSLKMMDHADSKGIECELHPRLDEALICRARQRALGDFWYGGYDYLMTVDDDILFPEDTIVELVKADKDIIGGVYRLKTAAHMGIAQRILGAQDWRPTVEAGEIVPADYVATGCMLVKRQVVADMIDQLPALEYRENLTQQPLWAFYQPFVYFNGEFSEYLSEDWAFCERAKMVGSEVWLHGGVHCKHWGKILYTLEMRANA